MTKIETEELLDYSDVLIRPKRSTMKSRNDVDIEREFSFKWASETWKGVPLIAANMDTTGTFEVYQVLSKHNIVTALHKFYTPMNTERPCPTLTRKTQQTFSTKSR